MPTLELGASQGLRYDYQAPTRSDGCTFVGVNALTGDMGMWDAVIGPGLRAAGHGTLLWNLRGQAGSPAAAGDVLDDRLVRGDLQRLLGAVAPPRPVAVGLSIGGLFAAQARLAGADMAGLVLINTLRRAGPRLAWINDAVLRAAAVGGLELLRDLFSPLLLNEERLAEMRPDVLGEGSYQPLDPASGPYRLLSDARASDWSIAWDRLDVPVLVVTGLQDRVFRDPADVEAIAATIPRVQRVDMADAGHMVPAERPQALLGALLAFADTL